MAYNDFDFEQDFYDTVENIGEDIMVNRVDDDGMPHLYNLKGDFEMATTAAYSTVDREMLVKGIITFPMKENKRPFSGSYYTREQVDDEINMFLSVIPYSHCRTVASIYAVQCNEVITLCDYKEVDDEDMNVVKVFSPYAENIPCYFTTTTRGFKEINAGSQDQTIYVATIPARFPVSPMQRLIRRTYVDGKLQETNYQIDSVSVDMLKENGVFFEVTGVIVCQIVLDTRKDSNIKKIAIGNHDGS